MRRINFHHLHIFMMTSEHFYALNIKDSDFYFHTNCSHVKEDYYVFAVIEDSKLERLVEANKKLKGEL